MANIGPYQDPYNGWRAVSGNHTAHEIMTDTSGRWDCYLNLGTFRIYRALW